LIAFKRGDSKEMLYFYYNQSEKSVSVALPKGTVLFGDKSTIMNPGDIRLIKQSL
jgi:hypothetical protein